METLTVLYDDAHLVVCVKPAGILSEDDGSPRCMPQLLREHYRALGQSEEVFAVHRLDREVGGVMVYSRSCASGCTPGARTRSACSSPRAVCRCSATGATARGTSSAARRSGRGSFPSATPSPASPSPAPTSPRTNTRGTCFKKIFPNKRQSGLQPLCRFLCRAGALSLPLGEARDVRTVRSVSPSVSQSSRRRSANEVKSVFCGGVYAAKNTLREPRPKGTGLGRPDG